MSIIKGQKKVLQFKNKFLHKSIFGPIFIFCAAEFAPFWVKKKNIDTPGNKVPLPF
jgi:hypothetical protein